MKLQEDKLTSARREANRQALTCIAIVSFASCLLVIAFGLLVRSVVPKLYPLIAAQVADLFRTTTTVLYVRSDGTGLTCNS